MHLFPFLLILIIHGGEQHRFLVSPMVDSFDLCATALPGGGPSFYGWPILPHGGGAYWNSSGSYIGGIGGTPDPQVGENQSFGEYFPCTDTKGEILGVAANFTNISSTIYALYVVNYGPTSNPAPTGAPGPTQWEQVAQLGAGRTGQVCWSVKPGDGIPLIGGVDSFGLAVSGTDFTAPIPPAGRVSTAPAVIIEGTIYFSITLPVP